MTHKIATVDPKSATNESMLRLKPQPLPSIHPVAELKATGALKLAYEETKQVLNVPWMGVVAMAFAHYPNFYATLWRGVGPICASQQFEDACQALRSHAEQAVSPLSAAALEPELTRAGYAAEEIEQIRNLIEVFSSGNMPYLLLATLARLLLEGYPLSTRRLVDPKPTSIAPPPKEPLILIEPHHADQALVQLYADIKATLGLSFVNTDYRALARWPSYFIQAWTGLKGQVHTTLYEVIVEGIHAKAIELALALPNPALLDSEQLKAAAIQDASFAEVRDVVRLFQYLLPGLVANIAFFRQQLLPKEHFSAKYSED